MAEEPGRKAAVLLLFLFAHFTLLDLVAGQRQGPGPARNNFDSPAPSPSSSPEPSPESAPAPAEPLSLKWCAVHGELENCTGLLNQLPSIEGSVWSCVPKDSKLECMQALRDGQADLVSLDAGMAYLGWVNYSMKALIAEEYCYHQQVYDALMVVNKETCDNNPNLSIKDFRGKKSCHAGYLFAGSWNYPVNFLLSAQLERIPADPELNDQTVIKNFFSASCAPSDDGHGICTACNATGSGAEGQCNSNNLYAGYAGAFRCLMEGMGDIAFLRSGTAQLFSSEGFLSQDWAKKSVTNFMYLCPTGGCRPINDDRSTCTLGSVASNTIMIPNSLPQTPRRVILETLLHHTQNWTAPLFSGTNAEDILLSASAEGLAVVTQVTKDFLGSSANVSRSISLLNSNQLRASDLEYVSSDCNGPVRVSLILVLLCLYLCP
eukprot:TRINITY_DN2972_c0_g2_i2.p1 TRINITY_DN2972_c0_g2~~TRINITY_DN2972_c0_g2_i2.p1  ORF type:complete len:434 (+),score=34.87 TRINITY_DN2972_c0_g2_i2:153-1454(+)